jgi:hypothetical protein
MPIIIMRNTFQTVGTEKPLCPRCGITSDLFYAPLNRGIGNTPIFRKCPNCLEYIEIFRHITVLYSTKSTPYFDKEKDA